MNVDLSFLPDALIGAEIPRPLSGTLSGHAAGEPFSKLVQARVHARYPEQTFQQHDFLNNLYAAHPEASTAKLRTALIPEPALAQLLGRGRAVTAAWSLDSPFTEKQNDTADFLVLQAGLVNVFDVKTRNTLLKGQPPNIISAFKVANACKQILKAGTSPNLNFIYVGINWVEAGPVLRCTSATIAELFKVPPEKLYINWTASLQIQFHVENLDQSYPGTVQNWCQDFLHLFYAKATSRALAFSSKFVKPFAVYAI